MSEKKDIKLLRKRAEKFRAFLFSKDALSFLFFLFLSAVIWFVHAGYKEQEKRITFPLNCVEIPKEIAIVSRPEEITVTFKDQGFSLFFYKKRSKIPITVSLSNLDPSKKQADLPTDNILTILQNRFNIVKSKLQLNTDTLKINYKRLTNRDLPVKLNPNLAKDSVLSKEANNTYILSEEAKITPTKIKVYGDEEQLRKLEFVQTKKIEIKNIQKDSTFSCELEPIPSINFSDDRVNVSLSVKKFTKEEKTLPVQLINNTNNYILSTVPSDVTVEYNVPQSIYGTEEDCVEIVLDYDEIKNNNPEKYKLKAIAKSKEISIIKLIPEEVTRITFKEQQ